MAKRRQKWEREEILAKIKEWAERYGEIPAATDWNPSDCRRSAQISLARADRWMERGRRFEEGEYPWPRTVQVLFGSWNDAIFEAGFTPRRESMPRLEPAEAIGDAIEEISRLIARANTSRSEVERQRVMMQIAQIAMRAVPIEAEQA